MGRIENVEKCFTLEVNLGFIQFHFIRFTVKITWDLRLWNRQLATVLYSTTIFETYANSR